MTLGPLTGCGYARLHQQLCEQYAVLYLLSWAYSVCIPCATFTPPLFAGSFVGHLQEHIPMTPEASLQERDCSNVGVMCSLGGGAQFLQSLQEQHASECPKRFIICPHCGLSVQMDAYQVGLLCVHTLIYCCECDH